MRKRDKHKKSDIESSQAAIIEEPEQVQIDEETLRREREEARRLWLEEQRRKYPVAPDGQLTVEDIMDRNRKKTWTVILSF